MDYIDMLPKQLFLTKLKVLHTDQMNYFYDDSHLYVDTDYVT